MYLTPCVIIPWELELHERRMSSSVSGAAEGRISALACVHALVSQSITRRGSLVRNVVERKRRDDVLFCTFESDVVEGLRTSHNLLSPLTDF